MNPGVAVLGGGGFGRGLARAVSRSGHEVMLWSRSGHEAGSGVRTTRNLGDLAAAELIYVAIPSEHVAEVARQLGEHLDGSHFLVHVSRGLVGANLTTLTQVLARETPARRLGVLGGPLVADALLGGTPSGAIVGTRFPEVADAVRESIGGTRLRIYQTGDVIGVEVASALVGLLTLAAGFAQGLGMGPAALAMMATRGMAEAARVGETLGADQSTFNGMAGIGDLIAAVSGDERPELWIGAELASGAGLEQACQEAGANIEGIRLAQRVADYALRVGCEAPIACAVSDVLAGRATAEEAVHGLMTRRVGSE